MDLRAQMGILCRLIKVPPRLYIVLFSPSRETVTYFPFTPLKRKKRKKGKRKHESAIHMTEARKMQMKHGEIFTNKEGTGGREGGRGRMGEKERERAKE